MMHLLRPCDRLARFTLLVLLRQKLCVSRASAARPGTQGQNLRLHSLSPWAPALAPATPPLRPGHARLVTQYSKAALRQLRLHELHGHAAEWPEIGVQGVALFRPHRPDERSGQHDIAWFEDAAKGSELIGKPGDAKRRMSEHAGRNAGLFDLLIPVHHATDPAQVNIH